VWPCVGFQTGAALCGVADLCELAEWSGLVWAYVLVWACVGLQNGMDLCGLAGLCGLPGRCVLGER